MNYERKQIIVKAFINLLQSSPIIQQRIGIPNYGNYQNIDISKQEFDIWMNYVYSVLDVTYQYTGLYDVTLTKMNITSLSMQNELSYKQRIIEINDEINVLAQKILQV